MATIYDKGDNWHLVISPNAKYVQEINEPAKGYSATLGQDMDTGKHVVMDVHYNKQKYTLDDVTKFVEKSRSCPKCDALDKEKMRLEGIEMREPNPNVKNFRADSNAGAGVGGGQGFSPEPAPFQAHAQQVQQVQPQPQSQSQSPLKDIFANVFFDAYLTTPGKYFLGMMLNDDKILETAMPKSPDGIPQFMEEMVDFLAGKIDFVRSPDEVKEYLSVLKKDDEGSGKVSTSSSSRDRRNKRKSTGNAVLIY